MKSLILLLLSSVLTQNAVLAQNAAPACDGRMATVRISEITPTGSVDGFLKAVAAHKEWYASHGLKDEIFATRIVVRDEKTRAQMYSDKQFMTFHIMPAGPQERPKQDAAWDAYVKLYRENSEIKSTYNVCMPNPASK